jgi:hypothetical protein
MVDPSELVRYELDDGGSVVVEVATTGRETRVGRRDVPTVVSDTFDQAIGRVRDAAVAALGQFQQMTRQPDQVEISFGIKLTAEAGAVLAKAGVEGQLAVKLTWRAPTGKPAADTSP